MTLRAISAENNLLFWDVKGNQFSEPVLNSDASFLFTLVNSSILHKYNATSGALLGTMDIDTAATGVAKLASFNDMVI